MRRFLDWFKPRTDLQAFFASLSPAKPGRNGYTKADRYRDFRAVFATESGRRVLAQLIDHCEGLPIVEKEVSDTHLTAYRMGQREPGLWIVRVLNAEPLPTERQQ